MRTAREILVKGMVQGVGFRWTSKKIADRHSVFGWVRNNPDGSVSLHIEGNPDQLDAFLTDLGDAMNPYITELHSSDSKPGKPCREFNVVH